jgi:gluconolactonase
MKARKLLAGSALTVSLLAACLSASALELATPAIAGVVKAGTAVNLVKDGFKAVEGPVPQADGGMLFTDNQANNIMRVAPDGSTSVWLEKTGGANALTWTPKGELVATQIGDLAIAVMKPGEAPRPLVHEFEGKTFNRPNDLVATRSGQIFFTDTAAANAAGPTLPSAVYQWSEKGPLLRITTDVARPNGVALSPDERTLYVANTSGEWVLAFDLDRKARVGKHRDFARLVLPASQTGAPPSTAGGADGLAVDEKGRLYVASTIGVQVFSAKGAALGTITLPKQPQNLAFAGPGRSWLYVVGRGSVYRIATLTHGPRRAGK